MNSRLPVVCDNCGLHFDLNIVGILESMVRLQEGDCRVVFSYCPECKYVSIVSIETEMYDRRRAEIDALRDRLKKLRSRSLREEMSNRARLSAMVKVKLGKQEEEVEKLCSKYEGCFSVKPLDGECKLVYTPRD